ncbi:MAG: hypothetical protein J0I52_04390 [Bordetella sp.]|nr:hypothetical protein [Bordetella sp.]
MSDQNQLPESVANHMQALLRSAIKDIDSNFWKGFAHANPDVVQGYLQAGATLLSQHLNAQAASAATAQNDTATSGGN